MHYSVFPELAMAPYLLSLVAQVAGQIATAPNCQLVVSSVETTTPANMAIAYEIEFTDFNPGDQLIEKARSPISSVFLEFGYGSYDDPVDQVLIRFAMDRGQTCHHELKVEYTQTSPERKGAAVELSQIVAAFLTKAEAPLTVHPDWQHLRTPTVSHE